MTQEDYVAWVHRFYDHWNAGEMDEFYAMLDEHIRDHNSEGNESGREGVKQVLNHIHSAFPDMQYTVDDVIADGHGKVAVRLTASGTQTGELWGSPPTGKHATWKEIRSAIIEDDICTDHWAVGDSLGMYIQLGLVQPPGRVSW